MKSYSLRVDGAHVALQLADVPRPDPGRGQVLLKMHAAGLNRGEFIPGGLIKGGASKPAGHRGRRRDRRARQRRLRAAGSASA
jgi:hypothetical protein